MDKDRKPSLSSSNPFQSSTLTFGDDQQVLQVWKTRSCSLSSTTPAAVGGIVEPVGRPRRGLRIVDWQRSSGDRAFQKFVTTAVISRKQVGLPACRYQCSRRLHDIMSPANPNEKPWDEVTLNEVWDSGKALARKAWNKTSRRMRVAAGILVFL